MQIGTFVLATVIGLGALTAGCGSSDGVTDSGTGSNDSERDTRELSACDFAPYPSVQWTQCELQNLALSQGSAGLYASLLPGVLAATAAYQQERFALLLSDPERQPNPNPCTTAVLCPVDPRLRDWAECCGIVEPVLFTSRSGGTLSGHVWATRSGPARRPGVLIINGSIVGVEPVYIWAAQVLAKAGFVVMSFDVQGEGMSDQFGEAPDQFEDAFAGTPVLGLFGPIPASGPGLGGNGLPFYDGGADALEFFLSTPDRPYVPVPSRSSGTSHAAKHQRRVAAGLNSAYNPYWDRLDTSALGLTGHSYGAIAATWLAQKDPRIDAVVAWDALCVPASPAPDEVVAFVGAPVNRPERGTPFLYGFAPECFGAPPGPAPAIRVPGLSITADYIAPFPYTAPPNPLDKQEASRRWSAAGVDTGSIVIRGGTHLDFTDVPAPGVPATLRGIDLTAWYTVAWFAKYLQHDADADRLLLTTRWQRDAAGAAADPGGDDNLFSWHYRSRLDVRRAGGGRFVCEDLRAGCAGQVPAAQDCGPAEYSFVGVATAPDAGLIPHCLDAGP